jgi:hypothetical protein
MRRSTYLPIVLLWLTSFRACQIVAFIPLGQVTTTAKFASCERPTDNLNTSFSPRNNLQIDALHFMQGVVQQTTLSVAAMLLCTQHVAMAAAPESYVFNHEYTDPLHPECKRKIQVTKDGMSFKYTGTAVGEKDDDAIMRGCTYGEIKEYGIRRESLKGEILPGNKMLFAGKEDRIGVWEPAGRGPSNGPYTDVDGIRWSDDDKWIVKDKSLSTVIGEFVFLAYIGVSTLAGFKGVYDRIQLDRNSFND